MMTSESLSRSDTLRDANRRLRVWLETITAGREPFVVTPDLMGALLSELLRVGAELRAQPAPAKGTDPAWDEELEAYRTHVERLRALLPSIHNQLLAERARLEAQQSRIRAADQWARASRQTL
jgi:hypothetical protein